MSFIFYLAYCLPCLLSHFVHLCIVVCFSYLIGCPYLECSELNSKLQDTLELIEELLDVALSKVCRSFDAGHYEKVQKAYNLLRKTQVGVVVLGYVVLFC